MKIKGLISEGTIVLKYEGKTINVQKAENADLFKEISLLIINDEEQELISRFLSLKDALESKTAGIFTIVDDQIKLKGDDRYIPKAISNKIIELYRAGQSFQPLIAFWKKLRENPSKDSREDLYGFMIANKIPITSQGDIIVEKGVSQVAKSYPGHLVDTHSKSVDNSIGMVVEMDRAKVNPNRNQTCSTGLHVGAPEYVRRHYSNDILIVCHVNPKDVVSVPIDYKNTKMRVCRYQVVGYSNRSRKFPEEGIALEGYFDEVPDAANQEIMNKHISEGAVQVNESENAKSKTDGVKSSKIEDNSIDRIAATAAVFEGKTAKEIIAYTKEVTGTEVLVSLKDKGRVIKKCAEAIIMKEDFDSIQNQDLEEDKKVQEESVTVTKKKAEKATVVKQEEVNLVDFTNDALKDFLKGKFNEKPRSKAPKQELLSIALDLLNASPNWGVTSKTDDNKIVSLIISERR